MSKYLYSVSQSRYNFNQSWKGRAIKTVRIKNYINDYSLLKNRALESVIIWDKYLAYATAFGIPNKITNSIYEGWYNLNINLQVIEKMLS